jgi:FKBP12-rapamycin complex-associated protein
VPNSDTLHDLIRGYRDNRKILLNVEHKLMQQIAPSNTYDSLTHAQKLEVFEHALANTEGEDLAKILWLKSETSEVRISYHHISAAPEIALTQDMYVCGCIYM